VLINLLNVALITLLVSLLKMSTITSEGIHGITVSLADKQEPTSPQHYTVCVGLQRSNGISVLTSYRQG